MSQRITPRHCPATIAIGRPRLGGRSGFTLIEVALAVGVAAVALTGLLVLLTTGVQTAREASNDSLTATIAQGLFNQVRSQPFDNIRLGSSTVNLAGFADLADQRTVDLPAYDADGRVSSTGPYFRCQAVFRPLPPLNHLAAVELRLMWPDIATPRNTNFFYTRVANLQCF